MARQFTSVGASCFCWSLLLSRNDVVFEEDRQKKKILQVFLKKAHCLCIWAKLQGSGEQT
jgi:hypothetical protein